MKRILMLALTALFLLPLFKAQTQVTGGTVPLELLRTRHIAVSVKFNGEGPFRLALDTGSPLTFISRKVAAKLGLLTQEASQKPAFMGMGGQATLKSVDINGVVVKDLKVMILDHPIVEMISKVEGGVEGLIGYSFFAHFRTTLDYANARADFTPVAYEPRDVIAGVMKRLMQSGDAPPVIAPAALLGIAVTAPDAADKGRGVVVAKVFAGSAAASAGIRAGDRLLTLAYRWTDTVNDCYAAASYLQPGGTAPVTLLREGKRMDVTIVPRLGL
jgi:hypothetical protein